MAFQKPATPKVGKENPSQVSFSTNSCNTMATSTCDPDLASSAVPPASLKLNTASKHTDKPKNKNKKSTHRPQYSRKYSTPPSRPLSPVGFPRTADLPELDLSLSVDTAPQEPDIFEDPETDYFSTTEHTQFIAARHARAKSRRQPVQGTSTNQKAYALDLKELLPHINEADFFLPPTPGGFLAQSQLTDYSRNEPRTFVRPGYRP